MRSHDDLGIHSSKQIRVLDSITYGLSKLEPTLPLKVYAKLIQKHSISNIRCIYNDNY